MVIFNNLYCLILIRCAPACNLFIIDEKIRLKLLNYKYLWIDHNGETKIYINEFSNEIPIFECFNYPLLVLFWYSNFIFFSKFIDQKCCYRFYSLDFESQILE